MSNDPIVDLRAELVAAAARQTIPAKRRKRFRRPLVLTAVLAGLSVPALAAATGVLPSAERSNAPHGDVRVGSTADERHAHGPFGVAIYETRDGDRCFAAGRVRDGSVGALGPDGNFTAMPLANGGGTCVRDDALVGFVVSELPANPGTLVVYGRTQPDVVELTVATDAQRETIEPNDDGSFIATFDDNAREVTITATAADGQTETARVQQRRPPSPDDIQRHAPRSAAETARP